jgi:hypothetical protein
MSDQESYHIEITKKPWYAWLFWALWLYLLVFFGQNAIASQAEFEPRAATIFWALFAVTLISGVIIFYIRNQKE